MEKMLTLKDVSNILGYTKDAQCRFVRKLRNEGHLKGVKIGNKILFKESDVEDFIEHQYELQNKEVKSTFRSKFKISKEEIKE